VAPPRPDVGVDSEDIFDALAGIVDARADAPTSIPADFSSVRRVGSIKPLSVLDEFIDCPGSARADFRESSKYFEQSTCHSDS
jgi:hypothetical protein